jgi:hypothetical protein
METVYGPQPEKHAWPPPGACFWSKWQASTQTEQYRVCIHPECSKVQYREAPRG